MLALAGVEMLRGRLEQDESLREGLEGAAAAQLGVGLTPGALRVDFWPPALRLPAPAVALAGGSRVELGATRIEMDLGHLLRGVAGVRGVDVEGPTRWVFAGGDLAGRVSLSLRPGASPAAGWQLEGEVTPASGGHLEIHGELREGGRFAGIVDVEDVEISPLSPLLSGESDGEATVSGRFSGRLAAAAPGGPPTLRLSSDAALLGLPPVRLDGPVALVVELPASPSPPAAPGRFAIDATGARVDYADALAKASGRGASLTGGIVREPSGRLRLQDVRFQVSRFEGEIGSSAETSR